MEGGLGESIAAVLAAIRGQLQNLDIVGLLQNPYFLIGSALFAVITVAKRMINALVLYLAGIGLALLFHYTVPGGVVSEVESQHLVMFAGGGLAICAILIYFLFIRSE
jgi:hypothetical protein